jgi:hypothetical protein
LQSQLHAKPTLHENQELATLSQVRGAIGDGQIRHGLICEDLAQSVEAFRACLELCIVMVRAPLAAMRQIKLMIRTSLI